MDSLDLDVLKHIVQRALVFVLFGLLNFKIVSFICHPTLLMLLLQNRLLVTCTLIMILPDHRQIIRREKQPRVYGCIYSSNEYIIYSLSPLVKAV